MRTILLVLVLVLLGLSGCRTITVSTEYGANMAPNAHGQYVPTYNVKLIVKN